MWRNLKIKKIHYFISKVHLIQAAYADIININTNVFLVFVRRYATPPV